MANSKQHLQLLQKTIWDGSLPLEIRLSSSECRTYDDSEPYFVHFPRLSYLPFLLPRLHAFFSTSLIDPAVLPHDGWFSFENVPLKWHFPLGLLYDLFSGAEPVSKSSKPTTHITAAGDDAEETEQMSPLPWRLVVHFTEWPDDQLVRLDRDGKVLHDAFVNGVKEADFLRNGTAKGIMSLSKEDSTKLWQAVEEHNLAIYNSINQKLLNTPGTSLRNIPLRIYLPSSGDAPSTESTTETKPDEAPLQRSLRVVQAPIAPMISNRNPLLSSHLPTRSSEPHTIGTALNRILPSLFPSRRTAILARPVLHGAVLPLSAPLEDIMRAATYSDGWIHLAVVMMS
ncbi:autophagy protein 5 [Xylona heveae TC161]|uniref:Autophagy protein 5 n=1 Tax=Xylona heveae (strain CBS 132557 / TC161) TaxID=1328760 RepID=A0A165IEQ7_XYLHT|nr:autophagy protein 5 [Xylona heveae TC161]KZF24789.1 autophagy protein 5 [Xylona heveae TC161]